MSDDPDQMITLSRQVTQLQGQVRALRLVVLRAAAALSIVLVAVGSVLPAWREEVDGGPRTYRVLTVGFQALSAYSDDTFGVVAGIGFLGLLLVLLLFCGVLVTWVIGGNGLAGQLWVCRVLGTLAVIGSVVAILFSLLALASDEPDVSAGIGAVVVLAGVVVGILVIRHRPWQDLWIGQRHQWGRPA